MACFNLVDSIFSFILGKITDAFGLKPMLYIGGTAHVIFYSFFIFYFQYSSLENLANNQYLIYLSVSIASIGDATCNVFSASAIGIHFEGKLEMAYANNRMFQTIGFIASFFLRNIWLLYATSAYNSVSITCYNICQYGTTFFISISVKTPKKKNNLTLRSN